MYPNGTVAVWLRQDLRACDWVVAGGHPVQVVPMQGSVSVGERPAESSSPHQCQVPPLSNPNACCSCHPHPLEGDVYIRRLDYETGGTCLGEGWMTQPVPCRHQCLLHQNMVCAGWGEVKALVFVDGNAGQQDSLVG